MYALCQIMPKLAWNKQVLKLILMVVIMSLVL